MYVYVAFEWTFFAHFNDQQTITTSNASEYRWKADAVREFFYLLSPTEKLARNSRWGGCVCHCWHGFWIVNGGYLWRLTECVFNGNDWCISVFILCQGWQFLLYVKHEYRKKSGRSDRNENDLHVFAKCVCVSFHHALLCCSGALRQSPWWLESGAEWSTAWTAAQRQPSHGPQAGRPSLIRTMGIFDSSLFFYISSWLVLFCM